MLSGKFHDVNGGGACQKCEKENIRMRPVAIRLTRTKMGARLARKLLVHKATTSNAGADEERDCIPELCGDRYGYYSKDLPGSLPVCVRCNSKISDTFSTKDKFSPGKTMSLALQP